MMPDVRLPTRHGALYAASTGRFAPATERLLQVVAGEIERLGGPPAPVVPEAPRIVPFFWWPLTLTAWRDGFRLRAPEGLGEDPGDLSALLGVHLLQLATARRFGAEPVGFDPDGAVHLAAGTLESEAVMMRRAPEPEPGSTGWHARPEGPLVPYEDPYEAVPTLTLFAERTALLAPLALPPGWFVRVRGDEVVEARPVG